MKWDAHPLFIKESAHIIFAWLSVNWWGVSARYSSHELRKAWPFVWSPAKSLGVAGLICCIPDFCKVFSHAVSCPRGVQRPLSGFDALGSTLTGSRSGFHRRSSCKAWWMPATSCSNWLIWFLALASILTSVVVYCGGGMEWRDGSGDCPSCKGNAKMFKIFGIQLTGWGTLLFPVHQRGEFSSVRATLRSEPKAQYLQGKTKD